MTCLRCGGGCLDLSEAGFSPKALEEAGECYIWGHGMYYTCNKPPKMDLRPDGTLRDCFGPVELDPEQYPNYRLPRRKR